MRSDSDDTKRCLAWPAAAMLLCCTGSRLRQWQPAQTCRRTALLRDALLALAGTQEEQSDIGSEAGSSPAVDASPGAATSSPRHHAHPSGSAQAPSALHRGVTSKLAPRMLSFAPEVRQEEPREGGLSQGDRVQSLSVTLSDQEPKSPKVCPLKACLLLHLGSDCWAQCCQTWSRVSSGRLF